MKPKKRFRTYSAVLMTVWRKGKSPSASLKISQPAGMACLYLPKIDWNALGAIGTLLAVVVALFQEPFRRWRNAPKLDIRWRHRDSDICRSVVANLPRIATNVRILVHNGGRKAAQHVDLLVTDLYRRQTDGSYELVDGFIPTPLQWTHSDQGYCEHLPPGQRLCDLGVFEGDDLLGGGHDRFTFCTQIQPTSEYNILHDGVFAVRIVASALNCKPATELITISVGPHIIVTPYPVPFSISVATRDVVKQIARSEQAQPRLAIPER